MKDKEFCDKNKKIAHFISLSFNVNEFEATSDYEFMAIYANFQYWDERDSDFELNPYEFLLFSSSWDWIIPVWSKWIGMITSKRMEIHPHKLNGHELIRVVENSFRTALFLNSKEDAFELILGAITLYESI